MAQPTWLIFLEVLAAVATIIGTIVAVDEARSRKAGGGTNETLPPSPAQPRPSLKPNIFTPITPKPTPSFIPLPAIIPLPDLEPCSSSSECQNGCCSNVHGLYECISLIIGFDSDDYCVTSLKGDWELCSSSSECHNGCCSNHYSEGLYKCTPLDGGFRSDLCVSW
mmetsp:Transcript_1188/g.2097  ORF Transcript_1188/g.2097 Transcript_1188/m.2097 type:complete len:166 (+) Transcript_1188:246-743(+)